VSDFADATVNLRKLMEGEAQILDTEKNVIGTFDIPKGALGCDEDGDIYVTETFAGILGESGRMAFLRINTDLGYTLYLPMGSHEEAAIFTEHNKAESGDFVVFPEGMYLAPRKGTGTSFFSKVKDQNTSMLLNNE
jgi:hypothetical protein